MIETRKDTTMPTNVGRHQDIRERAYAIWEQEGRIHGNDWAHWFRAEAETKSTYALLSEVRDATVTGNRAFISIRNIEWSVADQSSDTVSSWKFLIYWENGGNTPAKHMTNRVTYAAFENPIELGFEFPDIGNGQIDYSVIGPRGLRAAQINIPADVLEKVKNRSAHAYIWGWANYDDIFPGTNRHRTEFCTEIVVNGNPRAKDCTFLFQRHRLYNNMDDECLRVPQDTGIRAYYKFLDSADIDKVRIEGTIMVSSFQYFRELEVSQWGAIADPLDAASELTARGPFVIRENSPELEMVNKANIGLGMFQKFAEVSAGGVVDISGARFVHAIPNLYIFSLSVGEIDELTEEMCVKAERRYDACLRILDLAALRRRIFEDGKIRDLNIKVSDIFEPGWIQPVEYEARSRDIRDGGVIEPSPFKKDTKFKPQSEVRMLFILKEKAELPKNRIIIEIPDPESLFEEVFRNYRLPSRD
jgi:hypothetical protein